MILITNDDGFSAPGIKAVYAFLSGVGKPFYVSAPHIEKSGAGHSITLNAPLRVIEREGVGIEVEGTPTDCVYMALHGFLKERPEFVISGINRGGNLGNDLTYSGTFSAALEAYYNNLTSLAVSLHISDREFFTDELFTKAAKLLFEKIIPFIKKESSFDGFAERGMLFNINIPDIALKSDNPEIVWTILGKRNYGGEVIQRIDPRGNKYYWIGGNQVSFENIENSDCMAILDGKVSVTPISINLTDTKSINELKSKGAL